MVRRDELSLDIGADAKSSIFIFSTVSASPTAWLLGRYGRAVIKNVRLGEAVILSTGTSVPAQ